MANLSFYSSTTVALQTAIVSTWQDRLVTVGQFCAIGSFGAILNFLPLVLTVFTRLRRHEINIMIMNLASADFFLCISFLFGQSFYILWHEQLPSAGCHFLSFFHFTMAFASFIFPPVLAINRYVSLYHNHIYRQIYTKKTVIKMMAVCWTFCSIVPLIFMLAGKTGYDEDNHHCCMVLHARSDVGWTVAYWLVIIAPLLLFCDATLVYCNYKIYRKLQDHASRQDLDKNVIRKNREVLYFLVADMLFPICFHSIYHTFKFILVNRTSEFLKRFFISLYLVNSVLRGIVTLVMLRPYRLALRDAVRRIGWNCGPTVARNTAEEGSNYRTISNAMTARSSYPTRKEKMSEGGGAAMTPLCTANMSTLETSTACKTS